MSTASFDRLFRGGALTRPSTLAPSLRPHALIGLSVTNRDDEVRGRVGKSRNPPALNARPGKALDKRLGSARRFGFRLPGSKDPGGGDRRQRVVVKIHFFGHGGGGGGALKAHARYVARDAGKTPSVIPEPSREQDRRFDAREHATYLSDGRTGARGGFYDGLSDDVDGAARMAVWAREDKRHFRLMISPENGAAMHDLKPYMRELMERAEGALGGRLEWVAIDHWDTDNPHTHVVLRGRRSNGRPLILPRDFVKHGMRNMARDLATERLGLRTREDDRRALLREARAHRPTQLDNVLAAAIDGKTQVRIAELGRNAAPAMQTALKLRARELARLGLATEIRRNVLAFAPAWRERLREMELHLDIRKNLMRAQMPSRGASVGKSLGLPR